MLLGLVSKMFFVESVCERGGEGGYPQNPRGCEEPALYYRLSIVWSSAVSVVFQLNDLHLFQSENEASYDARS